MNHVIQEVTPEGRPLVRGLLEKRNAEAASGNSGWTKKKGQSKLDGVFYKVTLHVQKVDACFVAFLKLSHLSMCLGTNMWFLVAGESVALVITCWW